MSILLCQQALTLAPLCFVVLCALSATCLAEDREALATDAFRPQLRYTPRYGWMNDPNGLIYDHGKWHFFCQHNPTNVVWGNMHWNHAVSDDLVHWQEQGEALCPDDQGTMFSGSAVVDRDGVAGLGRDVQVIFYTHDVKDGYHFVQRLAWSKDRMTYEKLGGDPVVPFRARKNRDPKVFWHAPTKRWVMALYGTESGRHTMWIYSSANLRDWQRESSYVGGVAAKNDLWLFECPGLEELRIEGETNTAWVVWGAMPEYAVGAFDGRRFTPAEERLPGIAYVPGVPYHGNEAPYYAAQTFNDVPDGRKIWMAWFRLPKFEGAKTRHSASIPHELSLRRTTKGLRLVRHPARELEKLRCGECMSLEKFNGELAELHLSCKVAAGGKVSFDLRGVDLSYDAQTRQLKMAGTQVPWILTDGHLELVVYLDRVGAEVFSKDGLQMMPVHDAFPQSDRSTCSVTSMRGVSDAVFTAYKLRSIWK